MEKVRPWCGQPSDRGRLKIRSDQTFPPARGCASLALAVVPCPPSVHLSQVGVLSKGMDGSSCFGMEV